MDGVYYLVAVLLGGGVVLAARRSAGLYRRLAELSSSENRGRQLLDSWLEDLSLGYFDRASETAAQVALLQQAAADHQGWAHGLAAILGLLSLGFLAWKAWRWRRLGDPVPFLRHALAVSALCLAVGLTAPIFTFSAFGEVPVLGRVVLSYEVKSVLSMLGGLAAGGNWFVALLLALFSVVTPVAKVVLSHMVLDLPPGRGRRLALAIIHGVGRWSMTDVFVVAVLLAFLAGNQQQTTDAAVGVGLYFFAAYAVLSLAAGQLLVREEGRWRTAEDGP